VPLVGVKIHARQERKVKVLEDGRKLNAPLRNRNMAEVDVEEPVKQKRDITEAVLAEEIHGQYGKDKVGAVPHPL